jgi:predicted anti-sigma-YlaC factor YlaD
MRCRAAREAVSALLDGEPIEQDRDLDRHLAACPGCRTWASTARSVHRSLRLEIAPEVPDLTPAIVSEPPVPFRAGRRGRRLLLLLRAALAVSAGLQVLVSLPSVLGGPGPPEARHLGAWGLAFAVGLLTGALQPWRSRALLPLAIALTAAMALAMLLDSLADATPAMAASAHLPALVGMAVLWAMTRTGRRPPLDDGRQLNPLPGRRPPGEPTGLMRDAVGG